jgi:hypothetical protein
MNEMRMKKRFASRSSNWELSTMLQPMPARNPDKAATIPRVEGQVTVRTKLVKSNLLLKV